MGCLRLIFVPLAVLAGYIVTGLVVLVGLFAILFGAGVEFAYAGDTWRASDAFSAASLVVGFVAALAGGFVATRVGGRLALLGLAAVVAIGGLVTATGLARETDAIRFEGRPETRPAELDWTKAPVWSETPVWAEWGNLAVGVVGVLVGGAGALGRRKDK